MGLGGAELRSRIDREPALAVREGGEGARRRAPPGQRRPGRARLVLVGQPAPQRGQVERSGVLDAGPVRVLKERLDVAVVGAHGVPGEGALGRQMTAERRQRRAQRGRQVRPGCRVGRIGPPVVPSGAGTPMGKVCTGPGRLGTTSAMFYAASGRGGYARRSSPAVRARRWQRRWLTPDRGMLRLAGCYCAGWPADRDAVGCVSSGCLSTLRRRVRTGASAVRLGLGRVLGAAARRPWRGAGQRGSWRVAAHGQ